MSNILELIAYETENGLYYANKKTNYTGKRDTIGSVHGIKVNGELPIVSEHKSDWYFLPSVNKIESITTTEHGGYKDAYWKLRDESTHIEGLIPKMISAIDADEFENDYDWFIGSDSVYHAYRGLYTRVKEILPRITVDIVFKVDYLGKIKQELINNDYASMTVSILKDSNWGHKELDLKGIVHYYELEELLTPDLVLHNRPCYLTANQTYEIVRNHIKTHIDPKYARITSDYNFCFSVKKKIQIKPFIHKTEIKKSNGRGYAKPKFKTTNIEHKEVEIFEMCPSKPYQSYTPIVGFKGGSLADLVENMKLYLQELMEVINAPTHECEHCHGLGCTFDEVENMNKRGE